MPVRASAKRALRKDRTRTLDNIRRKRAAKRAIDTFKSQLDQKSLIQAISNIDKIAKHNIIHKNKASRLKSQLSKLLHNSKTS